MSRHMIVLFCMSWCLFPGTPRGEQVENGGTQRSQQREAVHRKFRPAPVWNEFWDSPDDANPPLDGLFDKLGMWLFEDISVERKGYTVRPISLELIIMHCHMDPANSGRAVVVPLEERFITYRGVFSQIDVYSGGHPKILVRGTARIIDAKTTATVAIITGHRRFAYENEQWVETGESFDRTDL